MTTPLKPSYEERDNPQIHALAQMLLAVIENRPATDGAIIAMAGQEFLALCFELLIEMAGDDLAAREVNYQAAIQLTDELRAELTTYHLKSLAVIALQAHRRRRVAEENERLARARMDDVKLDELPTSSTVN